MFEIIIVVWLTVLTHQANGIECERVDYGPNRTTSGYHCEKK